MNDRSIFGPDRETIAVAQLRGLTLMLKGRMLHRLLELRRFNPNQPRVPRGHRHGGRWVSDGSDHGALVQQISHDLPKLPEGRPPSGRERHRTARLIAIFIREASVTLRLGAILTRYAWLAESAAADVLAYLDGPKSLAELQAAVGEPKAGYDIHHIVERTSARRDGYPDDWIDGPDNLVRIPRFKHWEINGWYARGNREFGGLSPRDFLRGASWDERRRVGLDALTRFEVLHQ